MRHARYNEDRASDPVEVVFSRFYSSAQWRRLRNAYISRHPLCEECELRGRTAAAKMVDHIREVRDGGPRLDSNNLQALCHQCHAYKTHMAKRAR